MLRKWSTSYIQASLTLEHNPHTDTKHTNNTSVSLSKVKNLKHLHETVFWNADVLYSCELHSSNMAEMRRRFLY